MKYFYFGMCSLSVFNSCHHYLKGNTTMMWISIVCSVILLLKVVSIRQQEKNIELFLAQLEIKDR